MDIQMPNMDGIEATKRIREIESNAMKSTSDMHTPGGTSSGSSAIIVALTASSLATDRVNALAAGCNDFLTKPVSLLWLNNKIIEWGSIKVLQSWAVKGLISPHRQRPKEIEDSA
jgi:osomolarity two-component system, response regulator SSK1